MSLESHFADIRKGLATIEMMLPNLPADLRDRYGRLAERLRAGLAHAENLHEDDRHDEAVEQAAETWRLFREENPPRAIVENALETFGPLITSIVPPLELIENIALFMVHLGGLSYDLWKARALRSLFSPAVAPLILDDAAARQAIMKASPEFARAFRDELAAEEDAFSRLVVERYLTDGDVEWLWKGYADRFDSADDFRAAAEEFRTAAMDVIMARIDAHLRKRVDSEMIEASIGFDMLIAAVDRVRDDEDGTARLDALLTVFEALHRGGGQLPSVFNKVKKELEVDSSPRVSPG